jgi:transcriptional regulator with XRE-family HTH domain
MAPKEKTIRSLDFATRLATACDTNPLCPPMNFGRLTWLKAQLADGFSQGVSVETVRKWFSGEAKPKVDKLRMIATMLEVDEAWLSLGLQPDLTPREQKLRNATADGVINVVAGLIQMGGGHPAFPAADDQRAKEGAIDLYAIIKGAQYAIHVSLAREVNGEYHFTVPTRYDAAMQIGVIHEPNLAVCIVEISETAIEAGHKRGGSIDVVLDERAVKACRIRTFSKRL